eukprot:gene8218-11124_t
MKNQKYSSLEIEQELRLLNNGGSFLIRSISWCLLVVLIICSIVIVKELYIFNKSAKNNLALMSNQPQQIAFTMMSNPVKQIAFGSCTSYDLRQMNIWTDAVIPSSPDVWIWAGDMVYLDDAEVDCHKTISSPSQEWQKACNCSANDYLTSRPGNCLSGDVEHANERWLKALNNEQYNKFLEFMCPRSQELGYFPPRGSDPSVCDRMILGIYDDHDFGWNNGNRREHDKREYKTMFLDAIGEDPNSPRRGAERGAWQVHHLNKNHPKASIDIFILDERYERDAIPCDTREDYCKSIVLPDTSGRYAHEKGFCSDFLSGGLDGKGSCCQKDELIFFGWCKIESNKFNKFYREACDPTYELFGHRSLVLNELTGELHEPDGSETVDSYQDSPFCEILGRNQRKWLRKALSSSQAAVKLIVSGSVLLNDPSYHSSCGSNSQIESLKNITCRCGGDNLDCYRVGQLELLHILANVTGCPIVLTGDFHFADLKILQPGNQTKYGDYYNSKDNSKPIYQIMSSGMSDSTARSITCEDYTLDPLGLRPHGECSFVTGANFGRILFEYKSNIQEIASVSLQIMSGYTANVILQEINVDLGTCIG